MDTPAPRGLANIGDVRSFLKISRVCIYEHTRAGHLHAIKIGRAVRYDWADIERAAREGLPALKKPAPAPAAQANPEAPSQSAKRRPGRPRKSAAAPVLGQGQGQGGAA
jgi:predicted DNA-binding transcriptional regulator AlpA